MVQLRLWAQYDRKAVHDVFSPLTTFDPRGGPWGQSGIVPIPDRRGDFIFFVTFGRAQGHHAFDESITADGILTWQSQPAQRLHHPQIQRFIRHDARTNAIHLFLRTRPRQPYTYFGLLAYLSHDPSRERPVWFQWQILDWPPPFEVVEELGIDPRALRQPSDASTPLEAGGTLAFVDPPMPINPSLHPPTKGPARQAARYPGKDARDAALGLAGELLVIETEKATLVRAGRADLAARVAHVALTEGDAAGYDILSFSSDGTPRHIEVKTTTGGSSTGFFVSPNQIEFSRSHAASYALYRLFGYSHEARSASCFVVHGSLSESFELAPTEFRATMPREPAMRPEDGVVGP